MGSMLLFPVLLAISFWSCADMQSVPEQTPEVLVQMMGTSAKMLCKLRSRDTVHWYKLAPGERPKRILYETGGTPVFDDSSDRNRIQVRNDPTQPIYHLTINSLTLRDSGVYYCAYWYTTTVLAGSNTLAREQS
ncbi:hypothetical protein Nmel_000787 [Mimus melanotis]